MQPFRLAGAALQADVSGALYWPAERTLAVADLHLEKGSSYARRGQLLPPYDTAATLDRLRALVDGLRPERVLLLGDSFHDSEAPVRLAPQDRQRLVALAGITDLVWVEGNHDRGAHPAGLGRALAEARLGPLTFRHQAAAGSPAGEVSGHFHPKARLRLSAGSAHARCFVFDRRRVILPAFGAYAGGLDIRHPAIAGLFADGFKLIALGRRRAVLLPAAVAA